MIVPLRVDFAGGWLDVPKLARPGAFIVNCAIEPFHCRPGGGLGGSARRAIMAGCDPFESELRIAGWQDAAVLTETGLCVWRSGERPVLEAKYNPDFLGGCMAVLWTGFPHDTAGLLDHRRDYRLIEVAGWAAASAIGTRSVANVAVAIDDTYDAQLAEGMDALPFEYCTKKYLGSGWGGYALYLFLSPGDRSEWLREASTAGWEVQAIEPYMRGYEHGG